MFLDIEKFYFPNFHRLLKKYELQKSLLIFLRASNEYIFFYILKTILPILNLAIIMTRSTYNIFY